MKARSTSLISKDTQIQTLKYYLTPIKMAITKIKQNLVVIKCRQGYGDTGSYRVGGI